MQVCISEERERGGGGELELGAWQILAIVALACTGGYVRRASTQYHYSGYLRCLQCLRHSFLHGWRMGETDVCT